MATDFARLSGDINPLHVDAEYARSAGYPSPVLFGLMTSSLYSQLVGVYLPGKYALLQGIDLDFNAPCFVGEDAVEMAASSNPLGRNATPNDLLGAILFLLSPGAAYITGADLPISAGTVC